MRLWNAVVESLWTRGLEATSLTFRASHVTLCASCGAENVPGKLPFRLAVVLLEHGEWLATRGRADDARPFLAEARETFERLVTKPWLDRIGAVETVSEAGVSA